jgi:hypothetical protein
MPPAVRRMENFADGPATNPNAKRKGNEHKYTKLFTKSQVLLFMKLVRKLILRPKIEPGAAPERSRVANNTSHSTIPLFRAEFAY